MDRCLRAVLKESGVQGAHAHRFRHTLATELLGRGASFEEVADILGNSPEIVRKHYDGSGRRARDRGSMLWCSAWCRRPKRRAARRGFTGFSARFGHPRKNRPATFCETNQEIWRRKRDSNPRAPFDANGFQDRRFQPLTHSSSHHRIRFTEFVRLTATPVAANRHTYR